MIGWLGPLTGSQTAFGPWWGTIVFALTSAMGLYTLVFGPALQLVNSSIDAASRGRFDEVEALLDAVPRIARRWTVARLIHYRRSEIAFYEGRVHEAVEHATRAIETPAPWFEHANTVILLPLTRAHRAVAAASKGDETLARADIEAVRGCADAPPESLAMASLGEALLLARHDDRPALLSLLQRDRRLLLEQTTPRGRALVRSLQRMVEAPRSGVYRELGKRDEPAIRGTPIASWIASVAPAAGAFAPRWGTPTADHAETVGLDAPPDAHAVAALVGEQSAARRGSNRKAAKRALVLWMLLIAMFVAMWQLLQPSDPSRRAPLPRTPAPIAAAPAEGTVLPGLPWLFLVLCLALLALLGVPARTRRLRARLIGAARAFALGDLTKARDEYTALAKRADAVGAQGEHGLATLAVYGADFEHAVEHCERGLAKVARYSAAVTELIVPHLYAVRGRAFAALDRATEATAQLAQLSGEYPRFFGLSRSMMSVRLMQAVRAGDIAGARSLALRRTPDLPLDLRDETLADAVVAIEERLPEDVARLDRELKEDRDLSIWMVRVAPGVVEELRRCAAANRT
jgi:hypothetical protein